MNPEGVARKARVMVETSRKEPLMDRVQRAFEGEGYRLQKRTSVDIVMERRISGALERDLFRMGAFYWDRSDGIWARFRDPVEYVLLSVVRQTTKTTQIEAYRVLCANPETAFEGAVMDDSRKRADELKIFLERIKNEAESSGE